MNELEKIPTIELFYMAEWLRKNYPSGIDYENDYDNSPVEKLKSISIEMKKRLEIIPRIEILPIT